MFNLAVGGTSTGYGGGTDATTLSPQRLVVDYVRVYQWEDTPTTPASLAVTPVSNTQLQLNWQPSTVANDSTLTYNVFRSTQPGTKNTPANWVTAQVKGTSFTDTMLTPGTNYCYIVTASGENAPESAFSNEVCTKTPVSGTDTQPIAISTGAVVGSGNCVRETGFDSLGSRPDFVFQTTIAGRACRGLVSNPRGTFVHDT